MALVLYAHPFSSYSQKVLIALYENATSFEFRSLGPDDPDAVSAWMALWPLKRFPVLVDAGRTVVEASIIVEHLDRFHRGPVALLPDDAQAALDVRMMDRFFDNYIMTPMQQIVFDSRRIPEHHHPQSVTEARDLLDGAYHWLDGILADREWVAGAFSLADCAAAPSLFYADWAHPIDPNYTSLRAYRGRLLARPSFARAVDEARPFRALFPLGAPDRD